MVTQFFYRNHTGFFGLPLLLAEEAAEEGEEDVEGIEELKQKSHVPRGMVYGVRCMVYGVWCMVYGVQSFAMTNERVLYRELDQEDQRTEKLKEVSSYDECAATEDIRVSVFGCFACPTHSLAEESTPCGSRMNDGGEIGFVDDGDLIAAIFYGFQEEHIVAGRNLRIKIGFTGEPRLAADDEVCTGTHDSMTGFGSTHGKFLDSGVLGNL